MARIEVEVPLAVSSEAIRDATIVLARHQTTLDNLARSLAASEAPLTPAVLDQLSRIEMVWRQVEQLWGLLDAGQVTRLTGGDPETGRSHVANLRRRHGLLSVTRNGRRRYPGFQFDQHVQPTPHWGEIVRILVRANWNPEDILLWAVTPTGWLSGAVPIEILTSDPDRVLRAAHTVARGTVT